LELLIAANKKSPLGIFCWLRCSDFLLVTSVSVELSSWTIGLWKRFVNSNVSTVKVLFIQVSDCFLGFFSVWHLNESKSS
jgi:hypothetical protein